MARFMLGADLERLVAVRAPAWLRVTLERVPDTYLRSAAGRVIKASQREGDSAVRALSMGWKGLSNEEAALILGLINTPSCAVNYPDPLSGRARTGEFWITRREALYSGGAGEERVELQINAVEV